MADSKKTIERLKGLQILSESSGSMGVFILPDLIRETLELLEEQKPEKCEKCKYWVGGWIDDNDNFIPPRCKLFNEPHNADWFCPRWEGR